MGEVVLCIVIAGVVGLVVLGLTIRFISKNA